MTTVQHFLPLKVLLRGKIMKVFITANKNQYLLFFVPFIYLRENFNYARQEQPEKYFDFGFVPSDLRVAKYKPLWPIQTVKRSMTN